MTKISPLITLLCVAFTGIGLAQSPASYEQIKKMPLNEQRAVFLSLTPSQRTGLWIQHLGAQLGRSDLNREQKAFIKDIIVVMATTEGMFDKDNPEATRDALSSIDEGMKSLFTPELAAPIFGSFGLSSMTPAKGPGDPDGLEQDYGSYEELAPAEEVWNRPYLLFFECPTCHCSNVSDQCWFWG